jgi:hypothetical protein
LLLDVYAESVLTSSNRLAYVFPFKIGELLVLLRLSVYKLNDTITIWLCAVTLVGQDNFIF